jgi:hypothetical protein
MEMRCCTPPAMGGCSSDDAFSSCRHLCFVNEEDDHDDGGAASLDKSTTMQPFESLPRPSDTRSSVGSRPSYGLGVAASLPSPTRDPRSPLRAFQPISLNLPSDLCYGRTSLQGWPTDGVNNNSSTPWRPPTTHELVAPAMSISSYLETPEVQRVNAANSSTSHAMAHLLYTPQIPQKCLTWRSNLDAELDPVNAQYPADQLPPVTTLMENMLYLGGFPDAEMVPLLHSLGIRHIINCCAQDVITCPEVAREFYVHSLHSFDAEDYLILHNDYDSFAALVSNLLAHGEKVFVHCVAGVNRSVTLCAAYLMDRFALTPVEAVRVFRGNGRMRILDNRGFRHQLVDHYLQSGEIR